MEKSSIFVNTPVILLKSVKTIVALLITFSSLSQSWTWTRVADLPFATSNNALCEAVVNGNEFIQIQLFKVQ